MTIIRDLPIAAYHDSREYTSHSRLRDFIQRGARYYHDRHVARTIEREDTTAFQFGQAFETLFQCGPEAFERDVFVRPLGDGRSTAIKQAIAAATAAGKTVITLEDYEAMLAMCESLRDECPDGMALVEAAESQVTLRGEIDGVKVQARPDWLYLDEDTRTAYTIDLKSTKNLSDLLRDMDKCGPSVWGLGYHTQAATVRLLLEQEGYRSISSYLLVAEKQPSYRAACLDLEDLMPWGIRELSEHLPRLRDCLLKNSWRRAPSGIVRLARPEWAGRGEP